MARFVALLIEPFSDIVAFSQVRLGQAVDAVLLTPRTSVFAGPTSNNSGVSYVHDIYLLSLNSSECECSHFEAMAQLVLYSSRPFGEVLILSQVRFGQAVQHMSSRTHERASLPGRRAAALAFHMSWHSPPFFKDSECVCSHFEPGARL